MLRIPRRVRSTLLVVIPAALLAAGLFADRLLSAEWRWRAPLLEDVAQLTELEPVRAMPRTAAVLATFQAERYLEEGRPYTAWESLRPHVNLDGATGHALNLLAARAAAEWEGWSEVKGLLDGRDWLAGAASGEGLLLLARAEEELGDEAAAERSYRAYLNVPTAARRGVAHARLAGVLSAMDEHSRAAEAYMAAEADLPEIADWLQVMRIEQLVAAGDPSVTGVATGLSGGSAPVRLRRVELEAEGWIVAAETDRAIDRLGWEARVLNAQGARREAAELQLDRANLLLGSDRALEGRDILRAIAMDSDVPADVRLDAARDLDDLPENSIPEQLAEAEAYEAASQPGLAARSLRAAMDAGADADAARRLHLANLLFQERDYGPAREAYLNVAPLLSGALRAEAEARAARSLYRGRGSDRRAVEEFRDVVDQFPGTAAAGTALFLLGDAASTTEAGLAYYKRAAAIPQSESAREALYRVGDRSLRLDDTAGAIRAWEEYVARYPSGQATARVAYDVGKLHEAAGRMDRAEPMYTAAMRADPTSYYGVRAGQRLGVNPIDHVLAEPDPWVGLASESGDAGTVLRRLDDLERLGLEDAWDAELGAAIRAFDDQPYALLVLAEGLRDRHAPVEAIGIGRRLLEERGGDWDERLLKVVFPFLYRDLIFTEATRAGVDPILYAGLVRQESSFRSDARSWVGARGLGQIMPATGRWLAAGAGIRDYDTSLLEVPEVNVRMGTAYLGDLLDRYDGAADLALAGYNAGPGRADRWRRQYDHGRDTDAFREAIPFDETRQYVMLVLRNAAIYGRLYEGREMGIGARATD